MPGITWIGLVKNKPRNQTWLVVEPPLWKIWKSIDMIIPNIWENKKCSKPPTSCTLIHRASKSSKHTAVHGVLHIRMISQEPLSAKPNLRHLSRSWFYPNIPRNHGQSSTECITFLRNWHDTQVFHSCIWGFTPTQFVAPVCQKRMWELRNASGFALAFSSASWAVEPRLFARQVQDKARRSDTGLCQHRHDLGQLLCIQVNTHQIPRSKLHYRCFVDSNALTSSPTLLVEQYVC